MMKNVSRLPPKSNHFIELLGPIHKISSEFDHNFLSNPAEESAKA